MILNYTYDAANNPLSVGDMINGAAAGTISNTYDALNRPVRLTQSGVGAQTKRVDLGLDPLGQIVSLYRFSDLAGTQLVASSSMIYDQLNRTTAIRHQKGQTSLASYNLTYDLAGRITKIIDQDGTNNFAYDSRDQLTLADHSAAAIADEAYAYDSVGNRLTKGATAGLPSSAYQIGPNNRLLSDGTFNYTYDAEGQHETRTEIATGKVRDFQWDFRQRLEKVIDRTSAAGPATQTVAFGYDALDRRVFKTVTTGGTTKSTFFIHDRDHVLLDMSATGTQQSSTTPVVAARYLHGPAVDQILAQESSGVVLWALTDHLGTVRDLVSNSGQLVNHLTYDSFGVLLAQTDPNNSIRYRYTGREFDAETNLQYNRARYYDAALGRFLSEDPIGFFSGDVNRFRYVRNRPLVATDPSGLAETAGATFLDAINCPATGSLKTTGVKFRASPDDPWQDATPGMDLQSGDEVWVDANSTAVVKIGGTAIMHLESDTVLRIPFATAEENYADAYKRRTGIDIQQVNWWEQFKIKSSGAFCPQGWRKTPSPESRTMAVSTCMGRRRIHPGHQSGMASILGGINRGHSGMASK